jgi:hypothetical protein
MAIDKKKIKELAKTGLDAGKTKEEIYYEINANYKDVRAQKDIANIIRFIPEKWRIKKYGIYNTIFIVLLIIIDIANLITLNYGGIFWFGVLTYLAITRQTKYYYWFILFGVIIFISGIALSLYGYFGTGQNSLLIMIGSAILGLIFVLIGVYIPRFLTPNYVIAEEFVVDSNGEKRKRKRIKYN